MSLDKARELRQEAASLNADNQSLIDRVEDEHDGEWPDEEREQFDRRDEQVEKLLERARRLERQHDRNQELAEREEAESRTQEDREEATAESIVATDRYERAWTEWVRSGMSYENVSPESREVLREERQQSVGTTTAGGHTVPTEIANEITKRLQDFGGVRMSRARVVATSHGRDIDFPTADNVAQTGSLLAENTGASTTDVTFGLTTIGAFKYSSDFIKSSVELLQDTAFDISGFFADEISRRIGTITEQHFTTGTGSSQPNGVVTASSAGVTAAAIDDVTFDEILDLIHSVDPAYRRRGGEMMFNDATLKVLKKKKDGDGRPLWSPGVGQRQPDTIWDFPYIINQEMPDLGTANKPVLFGDFSRYVIRDAGGFRLRRLEERFAELDQVAWLALSRHDGDLLDTNAVKHLVNA